MFAKIGWRILPLLTVAYILNYIDRTNVGVAALTMNKAIGLTSAQFGTGAGILAIGYCIFEIPSNLALYRFGARRWIARIMITWGLVSAAMVFVAGPWSFYALRFALGVAEAGFFPGVAFYLCAWFPAQYRARVMAWFLVAIPASSLIGSPLSGAILGLDGWLGLAGWQWVFVLESLPCIILGIVVLRGLAERPADASWLTPAERSVATTCLASESRTRSISGLGRTFGDVRVWLISFIYLGFSIGSYGIQIWLPLILQQGHYSNQMVGLLAAIPYFFAVAGMIAWAAWVDRRGGAVGNIVLTCLLGAAGFGVALASDSTATSLVGLTIALVGVNAARAILWALPAQFLTGIAAAGGLAIISSVGTLGGFLGPAIVGWLRQATGSFTAGLVALGACLVISAGLAVILGRQGKHGALPQTP